MFISVTLKIDYESRKLDRFAPITPLHCICDVFVNLEKNKNVKLYSAKRLANCKNEDLF